MQQPQINGFFWWDDLLLDYGQVSKTPKRLH